MILKVLFFKIDLVPVNKQSSRKFEKKIFWFRFSTQFIIIIIIFSKNLNIQHSTHPVTLESSSFDGGSISPRYTGRSKTRLL